MSQENQQPSPDDALVRAFVSGDPQQVNWAMARMMPDLVRFADHRLRERHAWWREAQTVVNEALMYCKDKVHDCPNDAAVYSWVQRKIGWIVATPPPGVGAAQPPDDDSHWHPADPTDGPRTRIDTEEQRAHESIAFGRFQQIVTPLAADGPYTTIVEHFLWLERPWSVVEQLVDCNPNAARARLKRLREKLLPGLVLPLQQRLRPKAWQVVDLVLLSRLVPDDAARRFDLSSEEMRDIQHEIGAELKDRYGERGIRLLWERIWVPRRAQAATA